MNLILIGPILSFVWWMFFGLAGDWTPNKKMPHFIAKYNQQGWLKAGLATVFVIILWAIVFP